MLLSNCYVRFFIGYKKKSVVKSNSQSKVVCNNNNSGNNNSNSIDSDDTVIYCSKICFAVYQYHQMPYVTSTLDRA